MKSFISEYDIKQFLLKSQCDLLLPRLMSGKLEVKEK